MRSRTAGAWRTRRRRLFEAIKALPKAEQKAATAAHEGVRRIDALYAIEREAKALSDAERKALRQQKAMPLLNALYQWASALVAQTLPSGKLGDALGYLIKQWPKLIRYVDDGRLAIDTNLAENAIRPFALGRRYPQFVIMEGRRATIAQNRYLYASVGSRLHRFAFHNCRCFLLGVHPSRG